MQMKEYVTILDGFLAQDKVGRLKQRHISEAAVEYLKENPGPDEREVFFDIITVIFDKDEISLKYFPKAWIPMYT